MSRKFHIYIIMCSLGMLVLSACGNKSNEKLDEVYRLINEDKKELAMAKFANIPFANMRSDEDKAFYRLIKVRLDYIQYIPIKCDTVIDYSLNYYRKSGDKAKEAECLFYKSQILYEYLDKTKESIIYLKQAETLLEDVDDINLKHRIYEALANINMVYEVCDVALEYAFVNLQISEQANNKNWITYAYMLLSQIYRDMDDHKNTIKYYDLCMEYIKYLSYDHKMDFYNYLSTEYLSSDLEKSAFYAQKCIGTRNNASGYMNLGFIAQRRKQYDKADSLFRKGLPGASLFYQSVIWKGLVDMYIEQGNYKKAFEAQDSLWKIKDDTARKYKKDDIHRQQMEYDYQLKELAARQRMIYAVLGIVVLLLLSVIVFVWSKYRYSKAMRRVLEYQNLADGYAARIEELKREICSTHAADAGEHERKIEMLRTQIAEQKGRQAEILQDGKQRYDEIMERGGTTVKWRKGDFERFIEYYKLVDMIFVHRMETEYDHLSPKYCFFNILQHIGKNDEEIMNVLGISESTLRSVRSRIKAKYIGKE